MTKICYSSYLKNNKLSIKDHTKILNYIEINHHETHTQLIEKIMSAQMQLELIMTLLPAAHGNDKNG
jgi:hypothetical protein